MNSIESSVNVSELNENDVIDIDEVMPFELLEHAKEAVLETLPKKSRDKYTITDNNFKDWQSSHGTPAVSNDLILAYFHTLAEKKYKPTSLWAYHSMLKATLRTFEDIDIGKFKQVSAFPKTKSVGYKSVKARVFTEENVKTFIDQADDLSWLDIKVACIFGICGAMRTDEFACMNLNDVERHGNLFLVKISETKTHIPRSFTINGGFAVIVQKYIDLRPACLQPNDRLFCNYQRGNCTVQFVGKNKCSRMPRRIAAYLALAEPERYTGHSFRRTSVTILANSGADMETIMRHGGWRNESCAKVYIEDSLAYKARTGNIIQQSILGPVESSYVDPNEPPRVSSARTVSPTVGPVVAGTNVTASIARTIAPTVGPVAAGPTASIARTAPTVKPFVAGTTSLTVEANISRSDLPTIATTNAPIDEFFDSVLSDEEFIDIVDTASQSFQQQRDTEMSFHNDGGNASSSTVSTNSNSTNSVLNAILARSSKSVYFGRIENCHFNFYFGKQ